MDELLTMDEIKARFAPDWVLIADLDTDEALNIRSGKVLFHSPDREEVYKKAVELRPGHFAVRYLGEWPDDVEFMLSPFVVEELDA